MPQKTSREPDREAIRLLWQQGMGITPISRELDISRNMVRRTVRALDPEDIEKRRRVLPNTNQTVTQKEIGEKLQALCERLEAEDGPLLGGGME